MDTRGLAHLAAARVLALYLLSLLAAAGADLAWRPPEVARLAAHAATLGLALGLGSLLPDALSAVGASSLRARARLLAFLLFPLPGLLALAVVVAAPRLAAPAASALALLQVAVLLVAEALGVEVLALWGAFVLTLLAALAGGLPALVGLVGFLLLTAVFFGLDNVTRRLAPWPGVPAPPLGRVLADVLRAGAPPVLLLAVALLLLPDPPRGGLGGSPVALAPELQGAYQWLALVALAGGGTMALVLRWLRGGASEAPTLVELTEGRVEAEELLEPDVVDARYAPARGRIIRAYLQFLDRARHVGFRIERHMTPREIEERVRRPEDPLSRLTGLFMDARYGPDEPAADDVRAAEAASRAACAGLPRRRRARLPPSAPA